MTIVGAAFLGFMLGAVVMGLGVVIGAAWMHSAFTVRRS